jgi:hypothetical protein
MAEFVVGQWVECVEVVKSFDVTLEGFYKVKAIRAGTNDIYLENAVKMSWSVDRFRPVSWQVGRTYRTTLEGVTATIVSLKDRRSDCYYGILSDRRGEWAWVKTTGRVFQYENSETLPHLTPYLAEPEPSPAVETTEQIIESINAELNKPAEQQPTPSRYHRTIHGVTLDLYDLAEAYGIDSHRVFHAVKKLVMAGRRGHKDREQDLREAIVSIESELQKMKGGA